MRIEQRKSISWQTYLNSVFILDEQTGTMRKLDDAGCVFWNALQQFSDVDSIIQYILNVYPISREELEPTFFSFVADLEKYNVVVIIDA